LTKWFAILIILEIMPNNKEIPQYPIPLKDRLRNTFISVKEEVEDIATPLLDRLDIKFRLMKIGARDYATRHQIKRRDFLTGLAATSTTAAFGTDAVFTWNRMNKNVEDLNNQLPQPPKEVISKALIDVQTFESNQRLTDNKFQEGMSQEALVEIQNKKKIIKENTIYNKKLLKQVGPEMVRLGIDGFGVILTIPVAKAVQSFYDLPRFR
jgi:hypothetical protein